MVRASDPFLSVLCMHSCLFHGSEWENSVMQEFCVCSGAHVGLKITVTVSRRQSGCCFFPGSKLLYDSIHCFKIERCESSPWGDKYVDSYFPAVLTKTDS